MLMEWHSHSPFTQPAPFCVTFYIYDINVEVMNISSNFINTIQVKLRP